MYQKGFASQVPDQYSAINLNITYPSVVLNHAVFVTRLIPDLLKTGTGLEKYQVYSSIAAVKGLHFFIRSGIYPRFKEKYKEDTEKYLKYFDSSKLAMKSDRYEIIENLYKFMYLIGDNFGNSGILPSVQEDTDLATEETKTMKENKRALMLAVKLIRKYGAEKLQGMVRIRDQPPPEPKQDEINARTNVSRII